MLPRLATERLWLRPLTLADAAGLHAAYADPECLRYWHHPPSASPADTEREVRHLVDHEDQWAIGLAGADEVVGVVGFVDRLAPAERSGFGYLLRRSAWGLGYATEAGRAALAYGFDTVGVASVELWIRRDNRQSLRVAAKLGARFRTETQLHGRPHVVHGVTANEWRGEPEPPPAHYGAEPILAVSDVGEAVRWWVDVVGFRVGFVYGDPPTHGGVVPAGAWTGGPRVQLTSRPPLGTGGAMVYVTVSDVDALAARAEAAGAAIATPLGDRPWGVREIELIDRDGNRIRLGAG